VRLPFGANLLPLIEQGVSTFHLIADYHGASAGGFVLEAIRRTHRALVEQGRREQVTLLGSGGIVAAEHLPKAILCGLDAVGVDLSALIALQGRLKGEALLPDQAAIELPAFEVEWGTKRLLNLVASWRDQLLEILGAMGLREVRRVRGEMGRAMFQADLEREAFADIPGFGEHHG
jgi:glutamate synthase domain-containing protein 2